MKKFTLKRHKNIADLLANMYEITTEELKESSMGGITSDGENIEMSFEDEEDILKENGYYGYIDKNNVINFWLDDNKKISIEELIFFFGHEIGHNTGKSIEGDYIKNPEIHQKEENRADEYAKVSQLAYKFANKLCP